MTIINAERSIEINAPADKCYTIVADLEHMPEWDHSIKSVQILEHDEAGRPLRAELEVDAKVKTIRQVMRYAYEPSKISWVQEKGEMKSIEGFWSFEDLGAGQTRATYALTADPGRVLGLLLRGPVEGKVKDMMLGNAAAGLKARAES